MSVVLPYAIVAAQSRDPVLAPFTPELDLHLSRDTRKRECLPTSNLVAGELLGVARGARWSRWVARAGVGRGTLQGCLSKRC